MMTTKGTLVKYKTDESVLAEVLTTWNKRDIDPYCVESVAIIGMVKLVYLSGPDMGKERSIQTKNFYHFWERVNDND